MTAIVWDSLGERIFETGIEKGVFYDSDGIGVAWNGLISVEENIESKVQPLYFDGQKFNDIVTAGDFAATLKAFTYPDEFLPYEGILKDVDGYYITGQERNRFGLSYQTKIGDDVDGVSLGYKIHLLYNLTAKPMQRNYETMTLDTEAMEFEWEISSIPEFVEGYRPTAHVILDSRTAGSTMLTAIKLVLYGTTGVSPLLPPLKTLTNLIHTY